MADFRFGQYSVGGHSYWLTTGEVTGSNALLAVTDAENDIHYVSEELAGTDNFSTVAVPDGYGVPKEIIKGVDVSIMDEISRYIVEGRKDELELSLARLGDKVLGPDSRRERPETASKRTARRKMEMYDHEKSPKDFL